MLGKLLKYEIPSMGRKLGPLYIAWAAASILLGLSIGVFNGKGFIEILGPLLYGGVTTAVFVMMVVLIIQKYSNSLLGEEAYFNLTLPVSTTAHIANKTISALVWTVLTALAAGVSGILILLSSDGFHNLFSSNGWAEFWNSLSQVEGRTYLILIESFIALIFIIVKSVLAVYAAITIGHQAKNRTTLASIGAYIVLMTFESMIANSAIRSGMQTAIRFTDYGQAQLLALSVIGVTAVLSAIYFFICRELMERRLNLA